MSRRDDGYDHWIYNHYELLQIIPVKPGEFLAVYAGDKKDDGTCEVFGSAVDALALARVTTKHMRRRKGAAPIKSPAEQEFADDVEVHVVALGLSDGYWHICQDSANFAGLCRDGEDIYEAHGCLDQLKCGEPKRPAAAPLPSQEISPIPHREDGR